MGKWEFREVDFRKSERGEDFENKTKRLNVSVGKCDVKDFIVDTSKSPVGVTDHGCKLAGELIRLWNYGREMGEIPDLEHHGEKHHTMPDIERNHGRCEPDGFQEQRRRPIIKEKKSGTFAFGGKVDLSGGFSFPNIQRSSLGGVPKVNQVMADGVKLQEDYDMYG